MGVPLRRRGYRDAYKFVMHYNNITWLQRTGSSTEIFYILNWAVHIIGYNQYVQETFSDYVHPEYAEWFVFGNNNKVFTFYFKY